LGRYFGSGRLRNVGSQWEETLEATDKRGERCREAAGSEAVGGRAGETFGSNRANGREMSEAAGSEAVGGRRGRDVGSNGTKWEERFWDSSRKQRGRNVEQQRDKMGRERFGATGSSSQWKSGRETLETPVGKCAHSSVS